MADLLDAVRTQLLTKPAITNLVETRVYLDALPQGVTLPAVLLEDPDEDYETTLAGTKTKTRTSLQAHAVAETRAAAKAVADALEAELGWASGTWSGIAIKRVHVTGTVRSREAPRDGSQQWRHVHSILCVVWHQ